MRALLAALRRLGRTPQPVYTVRHLTPAAYLASRSAGANTVRVEGREA